MDRAVEVPMAAPPVVEIQEAAVAVAVVAAAAEEEVEEEVVAGHQYALAETRLHSEPVVC